MKKPLTLFQKILLSLVLVMLIIMFSDVLLRYFLDISLECGILILPSAAAGLIGLFVFFRRKGLLALVLLCTVSSLILIFYNVTKDGISGSRTAISGSEYSIEVGPRNYSIIKDYGLAEKIVAVKYSNAFFDPDSKTGVNRGYQVIVLKETPDSLYIEINSRLHKAVDSLKKK
ncbi:hypothetical protein [Sphingobacterium sp. SYP-B4668]|uniref:hypothetical protein n=1 Tax=Sphingobacterium sp. SYP-B4668 TaxID=2996035 RepID=UPI0022DDED68|nr:hypothetical protein [Sphingobacterium sp. SYP-B4668]